MIKHILYNYAVDAAALAVPYLSLLSSLLSVVLLVLLVLLILSNNKLDQVIMIHTM